ncbi:MAG TPA: response regulator [Planctomycetota bacterium]
MARIVVIEDEVDQAELYRMALEAAGHEILLLQDDVRDVGGEVQLIILDERLGGRSGSALIPGLRERWPGVRILVLTADPDVAEAAVEKGADEGRMKPIRLAQLVAGVEALLRR